MKGLELARKFYEEIGKPAFEKQFPEVMPYLAFGLAGSGSECLGFDDETSKDHDFEAGFCVFLPDESVVDRKTEFLLERAYSYLPKEFMGYKKSNISPVGGNRHGVIRMADFFAQKTSKPDGALSLKDWLYIPEYSILEAVNGEVFDDFYGQFLSVRQKLSYMPEDVRLKKLAGNLLLMGQTGLYNFNRCIKRGDSAAAQLCAAEFVKSALQTIFLLNKAYMPYYKWSFKALENLSQLSEYHDPLVYLISSGNDEKNAEKKAKIIEEICSAVALSIREQGITDTPCRELEKQAYLVNDKIIDNELRNLNIFAAV